MLARDAELALGVGSREPHADGLHQHLFASGQDARVFRLEHEPALAALAVDVGELREIERLGQLAGVVVGRRRLLRRSGQRRRARARPEDEDGPARAARKLPDWLNMQVPYPPSPRRASEKAARTPDWALRLRVAVPAVDARVLIARVPEDRADRLLMADPVRGSEQQVVERHADRMERVGDDAQRVAGAERIVVVGAAGLAEPSDAAATAAATSLASSAPLRRNRALRSTGPLALRWIARIVFRSLRSL